MRQRLQIPPTLHRTVIRTSEICRHARDRSILSILIVRRDPGCDRTGRSQTRDSSANILRQFARLRPSTFP